ncbi:hypothetical protein LCGC14_0651410 [marine sediment metagenome]|uniref:Uncharacterized protein n=1 Tax=marine sediment metagenome TaxID=412755 RepID=A0A0F9THX3_9ZZZZ
MEGVSNGQDFTGSVEGQAPVLGLLGKKPMVNITVWAKPTNWLARLLWRSLRYSIIATWDRYPEN